MFHLACYNATVTALGTNTDISAITDQAITISNSHYVLTEPGRLLGAYAQGTSITRARVNTPKLRATTLPYIVPVNRAVLPGNLPPFQSWHTYPLMLDPIDEIAVETSNDLAVGTEVHTLGLFIGLGQRPLPSGPVYTVRATSSFTAVSGAWTAGAFVLDQTLPAGRYAVVGMSFIGANAVFARLIFPGQYYRPGTFGETSFGNQDFGAVRMGSLGLLGEFDSIAQPQVEIFCNGVNTSQTTFMDIIRVR